MTASEMEDGAKEKLERVDSHGGAIPIREVSPVAGMKTLVAAVVVALAAGIVAWGLAGKFHVTERDKDEFRRPAGGNGRPVRYVLVAAAEFATRNGVIGYAILGAILPLGLGVTAGLLNGRRSIPRVFLAGFMGLVLGACGGTASSYVLVPIYFRNLETADLMFSTLIHLGMWAPVGAASGIAFGIGSGSRSVFVRCLIGGIIGAALATLLYDIPGAFFPLAHTERPFAEEAGTRLVANILLALCIAVGMVIFTSQKPRVATNAT